MGQGGDMTVMSNNNKSKIDGHNQAMMSMKKQVFEDEEKHKSN